MNQYPRRIPIDKLMWSSKWRMLWTWHVVIFPGDHEFVHSITDRVIIEGKNIEILFDYDGDKSGFNFTAFRPEHGTTPIEHRDILFCLYTFRDKVPQSVLEKSIAHA